MCGGCVWWVWVLHVGVCGKLWVVKTPTFRLAPMDMLRLQSFKKFSPLFFHMAIQSNTQVWFSIRSIWIEMEKSVSRF